VCARVHSLCVKFVCEVRVCASTCLSRGRNSTKRWLYVRASSCVLVCARVHSSCVKFVCKVCVCASTLPLERQKQHEEVVVCSCVKLCFGVCASTQFVCEVRV